MIEEFCYFLIIY